MVQPSSASPLAVSKPDRAPQRDPARAIAQGALSLALCIGLFACATPKPPPTISPARFVAAPITLSSTPTGGNLEPRHVIVMETPSPGWAPVLDQVRPSFRASEAYVSLREPNPAFIFPQVLTPVRIATPVPTSQTLRVFARVVPFEASGHDDAQPYTPALPE